MMVRLIDSRWTIGGSSFLIGLVTGGIWTWRKLDKQQLLDSHATKTNHFMSSALAGGIGITGLFIMIYRHRYAYPSPDQVFKKVLPLLRANLEVRQSVGTNLQTGQFRAYAYTGGGVQFIKTFPFLSWNNRQLEMMFQIHGQLSSAMVSTSCESSFFFTKPISPLFKTLAVDMPNGERILLKGQSNDVVFKGYTRLR